MSVDKERIATHCVCCGSGDLERSPAILMPFVAARTFGWYPQHIDGSWGLNTIENGMAYSICNSLNCNVCGHLFLDIRFSDSEMSNLYRDYRGADYVNLRERFEPGYKLRNESLSHGVSFLSKVEEFLKPHISSPLTILDWGGDTGVNTPFVKSAQQVDIYDISHKDVIEGVRCVTLDEASNKKYKLIICSQVLEHVPFPLDLIRQIKNCMDKESILYIELPCESLIRNSDQKLNLAKEKKHWHEHINFYTENSIKEMLNSCEIDLMELKISEVPMQNNKVFIYQAVCCLNNS